MEDKVVNFCIACEMEWDHLCVNQTLEKNLEIKVKYDLQKKEVI